MQSCHNRWWKTIFKRKQTGQFLTWLPWRLLNRGNLVWKRQLWCYLDERLPKLCWRGFYSLLFMSNRLLLHKSLLTLLLNMPLNWSTSCLLIHLHNADAVLPDLMFLHESWKAHNGSGKQSQIANIVLFLFLGGESIILENEKCHLCGLFQQRKTFFFCAS